MPDNINSLKVEVLVIGSGPAGISTAIGLRQKGIDVAVIGRRPNAIFKVGESLSPDAVQVLHDIGIDTHFLIQHHQVCLGNKSSWSSNQLHYTDFLNHPHGKGWHINRTLFEQQLVAYAQSIGIHFYERTILKGFERVDEGWHFQTRNGETGHTHFLVDASGRNAWLCRRLGIERVVEDRQMALVAWLQINSSATDPYSLIEALDSGWWYSALLPQDRMVAVFMTDTKHKDSPAEAFWSTQLRQSYHTQNRVSEYDANIIAPPRWMDASSGYLPQIYGNGWLAVGDAALCYDPISAHGITMALTSGRDAAIAIDSSLNQQSQALEEYEQRLKKAFAQYAFERGRLYAKASESFDTPYWRQRVLAAHRFLEQQGVWE
jgi:flavin-dependent dehydrogenase